MIDVQVSDCTGVLSWMFKFTVTYLNTQSLYYPHIVYIIINIIAAIIGCCVGFYSSFRCIITGFVSRAQKKIVK